jgi:hypothetical protein
MIINFSLYLHNTDLGKHGGLFLSPIQVKCINTIPVLAMFHANQSGLL